MNKKLFKIVTSITLATVCVAGAGCKGGASTGTGYDYKKQSDELLLFKSSDSDLDFFLNDYFKRHSGYIDENGVDQKVNSVTAGVNAVQFFWQEWNSMSYYWYNSYDGYETDRIKGIRSILENIPGVWLRTGLNPAIIAKNRKEMPQWTNITTTIMVIITMTTIIMTIITTTS